MRFPELNGLVAGMGFPVNPNNFAEPFLSLVSTTGQLSSGKVPFKSRPVF